MGCSFPERGVRPYTLIKRDGGELRFVARDVCACLGIGNTGDVIAALDDDEKGIDSIDTPGGRQEMSTVSEPGLYSLILRSRKPEAKRFKRWIVHEVLPSIRKTGSYGVPAIPNFTDPVAAAVHGRIVRKSGVSPMKPASRWSRGWRK